MKTIDKLLESNSLTELEEALEHYEILIEFFKNKSHTPAALFEEQRLLLVRHEFIKGNAKPD